MSRYLLIRCDDWHYDGFDYSTIKLLNSYRSEVVELNEDEIEDMLDKVSEGSVYETVDNGIIENKLRKVLGYEKV